LKYLGGFCENLIEFFGFSDFFVGKGTHSRKFGKNLVVSAKALIVTHKCWRLGLPLARRREKGGRAA